MQKGKGLLCAVLAMLMLAGCVGAAPASGGAPSQTASVAGENGALDDVTGTETAKIAEQALHFSVDDVIGVFVDLHFNADEYTSLFDQPTLAFLREMHGEYGMVTTLYCFYESYDGGFDLSQCTDAYAQEFAENAHWLRVGFHARKPEDFFSTLSVEQALADYQDMNRELARICGAASVDTVLRLHWWDADEDQLAAMAEEGLRGLLAGRRQTDDNYHLPEESVEALFVNDFLPGENGLFYTPTDLWLEDEKDLDSALAALAGPNAEGLASGLVVAFTHEYAMGDADMHAQIEQCASFARDNGWGFAFPLEFYQHKGLV